MSRSEEARLVVPRSLFEFVGADAAISCSRSDKSEQPEGAACELIRIKCCFKEGLKNLYIPERYLIDPGLPIGLWCTCTSVQVGVRRSDCGVSRRNVQCMRCSTACPQQHEENVEDLQ